MPFVPPRSAGLTSLDGGTEEGASRTVCSTTRVITVLGVMALTFMMAMYALEGRGSRFVAAFAVGCALSSAYGFASGAWPFGVVEAIWCVVAFGRYRATAIR